MQEEEVVVQTTSSGSLQGCFVQLTALSTASVQIGSATALFVYLYSLRLFARPVVSWLSTCPDLRFERLWNNVFFDAPQAYQRSVPD